MTTFVFYQTYLFRKWNEAYENVMSRRFGEREMLQLNVKQYVLIYTACNVIGRRLNKNRGPVTKESNAIRSLFDLYELSILSSSVVQIYLTLEIYL